MGLNMQMKCSDIFWLDHSGDPIELGSVKLQPVGLCVACELRIVLTFLRWILNHQKKSNILTH